MTDYARANRRNPAEPEVRLWRHLSNSQLGGFKFRRQYKVENRILDFFCPSINLGVEVDGDTHDVEADRISDDKLRRLGVTVVRFSNADVIGNMAGVLTSLLHTARSMPPRWPGPALPHPNPSPEGEGLLG